MSLFLSYLLGPDYLADGRGRLTDGLAFAHRDMASYSPKWLTIRRCSYIIAALGIVTNPWQITTTAATFIQVSGLRTLGQGLLRL